MRITKASLFNGLLFLYITTSSLYFFDSGGPQIGDPLVLVLFLSIVFLHYRGVSTAVRGVTQLSLMALMVAWVVFVAILNSLFYTSYEMVFPVLFYLFNLMALGSVAIMFSLNAERTKRYILTGAYISATITFIFVVSEAALTSRRITGPFNNPNQLAYYAICLWVIVLAVSSKGNTFRISNVIAMFFSSLFILSSASMTALAAMLLLLASTLLKGMQEGLRLKFVLFLPIMMTLGVLALINTELGMNMVQRSIERSDTLESKIENMEVSRGYARVFDNPEYLIIGVGERGRHRFEFRQEAHSSFVTMLFSYGFVGFFLFLSILFITVWRGPMYLWGGLGAILIYSATHNGLRFTLFWISIACMMQATKEYRIAKSRKAKTIAAEPMLGLQKT